MAIILGRKKLAVSIGDVCNAYCHDCASDAAWEVAKVTDWMTVFNYPALPVRADYFIACKACGDDHDLSKSDFKSIHHSVKTGRSLTDSPLKESLFNRIKRHQLQGK